MSSIPVIDFQKYGLHIEKADSVPREDLKELGDQMCEALQNIGFCYLKNHGVPDAQLKEVLELSKKFFSQPFEEKEKCAKPDGGYDGWIGLEKEKLNLQRPVGDYKETYNITPICEVWPTNIPEFETVLMDFLRKCIELALRVFDVISVGLNLEDKNFFRNCHKLIGQRGNVTALRSLFYPAIPMEKEIMEGQVRCGEHSDYGTLTLLFQDLVGGLEVKTRDGNYIPATPISSTIVVNIGDMMQRWTADKLIATRHRVLIPGEEIQKRRDRQSVALFVLPDDDAIIRCLDNSNKYEPITSQNYLNMRFFEKF
ncbi:uncharacterized protein LOC127724148 [Mytilus californianus]|uniref:uncharacterized protein LOC127724148 n=1 Tax=Mytilus californianus TaxID=6549 RepID=UPI00224586FB|nr:uncharacterized protein LOC127724148 [Mytilus californianus]